MPGRPAGRPGRGGVYTRRNGGRRRGSARRARARHGARGRGVDGRDDRADAGAAARRPGAEPHLDHVDHGNPDLRPSAAGRVGGAVSAAREIARRHRAGGLAAANDRGLRVSVRPGARSPDGGPELQPELLPRRELWQIAAVRRRATARPLSRRWRRQRWSFTGRRSARPSEGGRTPPWRSTVPSCSSSRASATSCRRRSGPGSSTRSASTRRRRKPPDVGFE